MEKKRCHQHAWVYSANRSNDDSAETTFLIMIISIPLRLDKLVPSHPICRIEPEWNKWLWYFTLYIKVIYILKKLILGKGGKVSQPKTTYSLAYDNPSDCKVSHSEENWSHDIISKQCVIVISSQSKARSIRKSKLLSKCLQIWFNSIFDQFCV